MNLSPAMRHKLAHMKAEQEPVNVEVVNTDSLHLKLIEFEEDRKYLKGFNAIADRVEHKRSVLVPKYKPYIEKYLEDGDVYSNPIFSDMIVWLFDIQELELAIDWCFKAIDLGLPLPEGWRRKDWGTVCADFVLQWAEKESAEGRSVEPYFSQVFEKVEKEWRLHEEVHAKWFKFAGLHLIRNEKGKPLASSVGCVETLQKALVLLEHADDKSEKAQVKTHINKINSRINALQEGKNL
ncbi:phage terminase small subunit [Vibrio mediterranei]